MGDDEYVDEVRNKINDFITYPSSYYGPYFEKEHHGTGRL